MQQRSTVIMGVAFQDTTSAVGSLLPMRLNISRICVPTDFSAPADHAVRYAALLARMFTAQLHLMHVLEHSGQLALHPDFTGSGSQTRAYLKQLEAAAEQAPATAGEPQAVGQSGQYSELLRSIAAQATERIDQVGEPWWSGLDVQRNVRYGHPVKEINHYVEAKEIELVVIGSHGHSKLATVVLGSVTERVVQTCGCPVLVVRPEHRFEQVEP